MLETCPQRGEAGAFFTGSSRSPGLFSDAKKRGHSALGRRVSAVLFSVLVTIGLVATRTQEAPAASAILKEYQVKAAFLYNFAKFIQWPDSAFADEHTPLCIGTIGHDPFGEALDDIAAKTVQARPVEIRRFEDIQDIDFCHILFINLSEQEQLAPLLARLKGRSILTVSEIEHFAQAGGMVNFVVQGQKIRLEINPLSAEQAGLKISSKLLQLATIITSASTPQQPSLVPPPAYPAQAIGH